MIGPVNRMGFANSANPWQVAQAKKGEQLPSFLLSWLVVFDEILSAGQSSISQQGKKVPAAMIRSNMKTSPFLICCKGKLAASLKTNQCCRGIDPLSISQIIKALQIKAFIIYRNKKIRIQVKKINPNYLNKRQMSRPKAYSIKPRSNTMPTICAYSMNLSLGLRPVIIS
jgi:hypothetical protein